jgi:hypothetical protein
VYLQLELGIACSVQRHPLARGTIVCRRAKTTTQISSSRWFALTQTGNATEMPRLKAVAEVFCKFESESETMNLKRPVQIDDMPPGKLELLNFNLNTAFQAAIGLWILSMVLEMFWTSSSEGVFQRSRISDRTTP